MELVSAFWAEEWPYSRPPTISNLETDSAQHQFLGLVSLRVFDLYPSPPSRGGKDGSPERFFIRNQPRFNLNGACLKGSC